MKNPTFLRYIQLGILMFVLSVGMVVATPARAFSADEVPVKISSGLIQTGETVVASWNTLVQDILPSVYLRVYEHISPSARQISAGWNAYAHTSLATTVFVANTFVDVCTRLPNAVLSLEAGISNVLAHGVRWSVATTAHSFKTVGTSALSFSSALSRAVGNSGRKSILTIADEFTTLGEAVLSLHTTLSSILVDGAQETVAVLVQDARMVAHTTQTMARNAQGVWHSSLAAVAESFDIPQASTTSASTATFFDKVKFVVRRWLGITDAVQTVITLPPIITTTPTGQTLPPQERGERVVETRTVNNVVSGVTSSDVADAVEALRTELLPKIKLAARSPVANFPENSYLEISGGTLTGPVDGTGLTLSGNLSVGGTISDSDGDVGADGYVLQSTATGTNWVATSSLGISAGGSAGEGFSTTSADYWKGVNDFFSTTSADYLATQRNFFSTTSANTFINSSSTIAHASGGATGNVLQWNGLSWVSVATSTLGISQDLTGYLTLSAWYATTTDALDEGTTNRYYTDPRVQTYLDTLSKGYFFATTSADYWKSTTNFFSTTSANTFINSSSTIAHASGGATGNILQWNGVTWVSVSTTTLGFVDTNEWTDGGAFDYDLENVYVGTSTEVVNQPLFAVGTSTPLFQIATTGRALFSSTLDFSFGRLNVDFSRWTVEHETGLFVMNPGQTQWRDVYADDYILNSTGQVKFSDTNPHTGTKDTGLARSSAGVLKVTDGSTGDGSINVAVGSNTAPSFSFDDDPDTGWYRSAANTVSFAANGLQQFSIGPNLLTAVQGQTWNGAGGSILTGWGRPLEQNTAGVGSPNILTIAESMKLLTNEGTTAKNYHTLPSAVNGRGMYYSFTVQDTDGLRITAAAGDTIRIANNVTAAAGYIESTAIGSVVTLTEINATEWVADSASGVWTDGTFTYTNTGSSEWTDGGTFDYDLENVYVGTSTEVVNQPLFVVGTSSLLFSVESGRIKFQEDNVGTIANIGRIFLNSAGSSAVGLKSEGTSLAVVPFGFGTGYSSINANEFASYLANGSKQKLGLRTQQAIPQLYLSSDYQIRWNADDDIGSDTTSDVGIARLSAGVLGITGGSTGGGGALMAEYFTATTTATSTLPTLSVTGLLYDATGTGGDSGMILQTTGTGITWVATSTLGFSGGGSSEWIDAGAFVYPGEGDYASFPYLVSTSTATSTFAGGIEITGDIVPTADNAYSLGASTTQWKDVWIGPGSLYINGQEVLHEDASNIVVSADNNQSLHLKTLGSGDIELNPTGSGLVYIKGNTQFTGGKVVSTTDNSTLLFEDGISGGNIEVAVNTISATNLNGSILLSPAGLGNVNVTGDLDVDGYLTLDRGIYDNSASLGSDGMVLQSTGSGVQWVATSTLGIVGGGSSQWTTSGSNIYYPGGLTAGNVGIGTTSPYAKLSVHGNNTDGLADLFVVATSTLTSTTTVFSIDRTGAITTRAPQISYAVAATSTILNNALYAWTIATSTTDLPIISINTLTGSGGKATTTITGGLLVNGGAIAYDYGSNVTSIENLNLGNMRFDDNAGVVSWINLPIITGPIAGTPESFSAQIDDTSVLTVYGESNGSGGVKNTRVGVGTTSPIATLSVTGASTENPFVVASSTNAHLLTLTMAGNLGIGTSSPYARLSVAGPAVAEYFAATSTGIASAFPYASSTAQTVTNLIYVGSGTDAGGTAFQIKSNASKQRGIYGTTQPAFYYDGNSGDSVVNASFSGSSVIFKVNDIEQARVSNAGNLHVTNKLGVGGITPTVPLDVQSSTSALGTSTIQKWGYNSNVLAYNLFLEQNVTSGVVRWVFGEKNNSVDYPNMLAFDRGKVGVGTSTPYAKLSIHGNNPDGLETLFAVATSTLTSTTTVFSIDRMGTTTVSGGLKVANILYDGTSFGGANGMVLKSTGTGVTWVATSTLGLGGGGGSSQWTSVGMGINYSGGNVGIGSSTPYAVLSILGPAGTSVTQATTTLFVQGGIGYDDGAGTGGPGSPLKLYAGAGGSTVSAANTILGGNGGGLVFSAGDGGSGSDLDEGEATVQGGDGGGITLMAGNGGSAIGGFSNTDGAGGNILISGGTGSTPGNIILNQSNGGNVGIGVVPTFKLSVTGTVGFSGSLSAEAGSDNYLCIDPVTFEVTNGGANCGASSERFKENIYDMTYGLADVMKLHPVSYNYKKEINPDQSTRIGFIAEEIAVVIPEVVDFEKDGTPQSVDYEKLVALLTKAIQELSAKIDSLFADVELMLANASTGVSHFFEIVVHRITTDELCVGATCVNEAQLQELLDSANVTTTPPPVEEPPVDEPPADVPPTDEPPVEEPPVVEEPAPVVDTPPAEEPAGEPTPPADAPAEGSTP